MVVQSREVHGTSASVNNLSPRRVLVHGTTHVDVSDWCQTLAGVRLTVTAVPGHAVS